MIEYLEKLTADKEWQEALTYAEHLLLTGAHSMKDMIAIQCALTASRVELGDYSGAVVAGETAVRLAGDILEWDYFGLACMDLGAAYYYLSDWDQAIYTWLEFLTALRFYDKSAQYEARVRYNLGLIQTARGDFAEGCRSMQQAVLAAERLGTEQLAHGIRLALVGSLLKAEQMQLIPRLLAQSGRYLRRHRDTIGIRESEPWHTKIRIEYTLATNRLSKARRLALRELLGSGARSDQQFAFHMILAQMAVQQGCKHEALGHFLAARSHAVQCHRQDLESEAGTAISQLSADGATLKHVVDRYYLGDLSLLMEEDLDSHV
jgi:tetratricopeptide (TPR) repeat protein